MAYFNSIFFACGLHANDRLFLLSLLLHLQSQPVEDFYRGSGKLLEFDLPGGIPESWPRLLEALNLDEYEERRTAAA